jgi:hypothetical protein
MSVSAASSRSNSRNNSIEITSETTLNQLRALDFSEGAHGGSGSRRRAQQDMGRSLNFLNLDRRATMTPSALNSKTVGGASPRLRLMQNRIRRLRKTSHFDSADRLYSSDSALFSRKAETAVPARHDVWFKSLYPKQGALEKLDEAEQEYEDSQRDDDDEHLELELNMSGTDLWLFGFNQSAPGFLPGEGPARDSIEEEESHIRR